MTRVDASIETRAVKAAKSTKSILISEADFDVGEQYQAMVQAAPHAGAIVFFVGLVRDFYTPDKSSQVSHLELEHYAGMTEGVCQDIINEAQQRFAFDRARVVHRVGKLSANEQIVFVDIANASNRKHLLSLIGTFFKALTISRPIEN